MIKETKDHSFLTIAVCIIIFSSLFMFLEFQYINLYVKLNENVYDIGKAFVDYEEGENELIKNASKDVINVEVVDKKIEKLYYNGSVSYSFTLTISSEDGFNNEVGLSSEEYDSISIGDKIYITVYRNDDVFGVKPDSNDNIVAIRYCNRIKDS